MNMNVYCIAQDDVKDVEDAEDVEDVEDAHYAEIKQCQAKSTVAPPPRPPPPVYAAPSSSSCSYIYTAPRKTRKAPVIPSRNIDLISLWWWWSFVNILER